ncbi:hypothetical protein SE19_07150 [Acidiplasma aeolicum]|uniref:DUF2079 domain-containing protein n=6 Tax=Ferroplasmaceae TaxID=90142 RepID=A0A0N8VKT3_9ARCH|nr:hypothetical protein TZ01_07675 [Acidiplasma sp. MBA-1]KPV46067.1 hypothetical protein SE19_07150 [Acidiplasma aeolicum]KQB34604.1 hypothetical protein AOG55_00685 [Acidiplasma cupricumulans]
MKLNGHNFIFKFTYTIYMNGIFNNQHLVLKRRKFDKNLIITLITGIIFSVIFSAYSIYKYYSLDASAYDLGLHSNILWNAIHGESFYTGLLGGNFLAEHFAPFEYLQLPLYYLYPSPVSLLLFQDIFLAISVIPLYEILKFLLKNKIKNDFLYSIIIFITLFSYELSPFTASIYSFDFHNMAFLPFFIFMAIYAYLYNKKILNIAMLIFIVTLHSNFVYISLMIILFEMVYSRKYKNLNLMFSEIRPKWLLLVLFILFTLTGFAYIEFAGIMKGIISGHVSSVTLTTGESGTVPGGLMGMVRALFTDPAYLFSFISANYMLKISYLVLLFATTGFMPLYFPEILIIGLPYFGYAFTSSYGSYYTLGYQYAAMIYPVMFLGIAFGISKIIDNLNSNNKNRLTPKKIYNYYKSHGQNNIIKVIIVILIIGLILGLVYNPLVPYDSMAPNDISGIHMTPDTRFLLNERKYIPENSTILVENNLMPLFSDYKNVYSPPFSPLPNYTEFDYIIYMNNTFWADTGGNNSLIYIATYLLDHGYITPYAEYNNQVIILKKA